MGVSNLDIKTIRGQFPVLDQKINGKPLVYFDNAATTQKPKQVINALIDYYQGYNANIHRGIHTLAERATSAFEETRAAIARFINAPSSDEVIFTYGTTDSINLVAQTFGRSSIGKGGEIIISTMEHHSNIVPWQMLCETNGCTLKIIPVTDEGELDMAGFEKLLSDRTRLVSIPHASNALGTVNPIKQIIRKAHAAGAKVLIDGAQGAAHLELDVKDLDVDFYAFSLHKMYGPTGMGILFGKRELLEAIPPYRGGGEMIREVTFEKTIYNDIPYKFEAGTPNIADVVAAKAAVEFIESIGKEALAAYENSLLNYATEVLSGIEGLQIVGQAKEKVSVVSFIMEGIHHQDLAVILDQQGIAVRTGHHCTQPLMQRFNISGTTRASFAVYNTIEEIDILKTGVERAVKMLR